MTDGHRDCVNCGWTLEPESFPSPESNVCCICEDPANGVVPTPLGKRDTMSAMHTIRLEIIYHMEEMDGHPEASAEIAFDQVWAALRGEESAYGWPQDGRLLLRVTGYEGEYDENAPVYHASDPRSHG